MCVYVLSVCSEMTSAVISAKLEGKHALFDDMRHSKFVICNEIQNLADTVCSLVRRGELPCALSQ